MPNFDDNSSNQIKEPEIPKTLNSSDKLVEPINESDN